MWKAEILILMATLFCERTCFANRNAAKQFSEEAYWRESLRKEALRNAGVFIKALWKQLESLEFFHEYRRFDEINVYIKSLVRLNPSIAKVFSIGKSFEGRKLKVIKIGSRRSKCKPAIWIDGGTHAREWISPAAVVFIVNKLILEFRIKKDLIDYFHWYILPVANPDGYEYSHEYDRFWRKNRNSSNKTCPGVDLNRNWKYHWRESGASSNACEDIYAGKGPFSEPETKAISKFIKKKMKRRKFIAFLTFHSFGQEWLIPWGWTKKHPSDYKELVRVAKVAVGALEKVRGTKYKIKPSNRLEGLAAGGSDDWAKGVAGIKYSYTIELPDKGFYNFELPKEQILVTGEETWEAVKALGKAIRDKKRRKPTYKKSGRKRGKKTVKKTN